MFRMRGGTAMAVRDGQPLLRDKNLGKGYGGRMVSILCRGCETAPETVAEDFPFFDNKGGTPLFCWKHRFQQNKITETGDWEAARRFWRSRNMVAGNRRQVEEDT